MKNMRFRVYVQHNSPNINWSLKRFKVAEIDESHIMFTTDCPQDVVFEITELVAVRIFQKFFIQQ
jgi:hypothetical protein